MLRLAHLCVHFIFKLFKAKIIAGRLVSLLPMFRLPLLLIAMYIIAGCTNDRGQWLSQRSTHFKSDTLQPRSSTLTVPISIPLREVESAINNRLPKQLAENKALQAGLLIDIYRGGSASLTAYDNKLIWGIPLTISVSHQLISGELTRFEVWPQFETRIDLLETYALQSTTRLTRIDWLDPAEVQVLGSKIDLTNLLDQVILSKRQEIATLIDDELSKLDMRIILQRTWHRLCNPIRINRAVQPVYLLITPDSITIGALKLTKSQLSLDMRVRGTLQTVFDSVENVREPLDFPTLRISNNLPRDNEFYLPIVADFDRINRIFEKEVRGLTFDVEGRNLSIDSINILSVDSLLLISARIGGDITIETELLGRPYYDPETRTLSVKGFDFHVRQTNFSLLHLGDYFFHDEIIDALVDRISFPVGSFIDTIPDLIYHGVERGKSGDKINLNAVLDTIAMDQLCIGYNEISLMLFAKGSLLLEVEKLKIKAPQNKVVI